MRSLRKTGAAKQLAVTDNRKMVGPQQICGRYFHCLVFNIRLGKGGQPICGNKVRKGTMSMTEKEGQAKMPGSGYGIAGPLQKIGVLTKLGLK